MISAAAATAQPTPSPASAASTAQGTAWMKGAGLTPDPALRFGTLANGMRYVIRVNRTPPGQASLRLRIDSGSLNEAEDQRGVAHFLEHMVLNGTKNVPEGEFIKRLERQGMRFGPDTNASTDFSQTVFKLDLPQTAKPTLDEAFFLLREVAGRASLDAAAIDRERGIILSEERARATPGYRLLTQQLAWLYPGQLLPNRLPIGTTAVISGVPRQRMLDFYRAWYRPEKATLVVVGDVDPADIEKRIADLFADWRGVGPAGIPADQGRLQSRGTEAKVFVDPAIGAGISLQWLRPADLTPDNLESRRSDLEMGLAAAILNRRLERLAQNDTAPPFVSARASVDDNERTADATSISAQARLGDWRSALGAIEREQRRLVTYGVTADEVERELTGIRTALSAGVASAATRSTPALAEGLVGAIDRERVVMSPADQLAFFKRIEPGLTATAIHAAAKRMFAGSGPLITLTLPRPAATEATVLEAFTQSRAVAVTAPAAQARVAWPYESFGAPGKVAEQRVIPEIGTTLVRFANGVRLTVRPSSARKEQVLVSVRFGDGRLAMRPDRASPEWALGTALAMGGTGKLDTDQINRALTGKVVGANLGVDDERFQLGGATRAEDLGIQLQLLTAFLTDAGWRPAGWERMRVTANSIHDRLESTPGGVLSRELGGILRSGDRRWGIPSRLEMRGSTIADGRALLAPALADGGIEVIVAGDVTVEQAIAETARTLGALPARSDRRIAPEPLRFPTPAAGGAAAAPITLFHKGREDQAAAFIAWPTTGYGPATRQDVRVLALLGAVMQLRITDQLREKEGVSYSPNAGHAASSVWRDYGYLGAQIEVPPAKLDSFFAESDAIAADLAARPVTADELDRARRPLVATLARSREGNGYWMDALEKIGTDPFVLTSITTQAADYARVTPAMLQEAARRFLVPARAVRIKVVKGEPLMRIVVPAVPKQD